MPIYITCDYCGKRIDTYNRLPPKNYSYGTPAEEPTKFTTITLAGSAFIDTKDFQNGVFCSVLCHDTLKECFAVWEKEKAE